MDEKSILVSVVIACYNGEKYIDLCLDSLVSQTYKNIEIIVCDDCSNDHSFEILKKWAKRDERVIVLRNDKNLMAGETRNRCFKASHGEYYLIQDIDDISKPNRIEVLLNSLINESGSIDFVSSQMAAFEKNPSVITKIMDFRVEYPQKWHFLWGQPFFHPATLFRKQCIDMVGGYRGVKENRRAEDYDLFMRLYANGFKGKNISVPLYLFRLDAANIRRRDFKGRIGEYKARLYGFKELGMMPWAYPFTLKPFISYIYQQIRYASLLKKENKESIH